MKTAPAPVAWTVAKSPVAYADAVAEMEAYVQSIRSGAAPERVWLVEHPPLYTAGTNAKPEDLLEPDRFPVHRTGRGGQYTYHGPGQRVAYVMLDLKARTPDVRRFVTTLEDWIIDTLAAFGVAAGRSPGNIGIWVPRPDKGVGREDKIAAIGIRIRHWVTFHGIALNVAPDLSDFAGIVPCGVHGQGVTSLADLGVRTTMVDADAALRAAFETHFGRTAAKDYAVGRIMNPESVGPS